MEGRKSYIHPVVVRNKDELREFGLHGIEEIEHGNEPAFLYAIALGSGTTGSLPLIVLRHLNLPRRYEQMGIASGKHCIHLSARDAQVRLVSPLLEDIYDDGTEVLIMSTADLDTHLERLLVDYRPTHVGGFLSFIENAARYAPEASREIEVIEVTGEMMSEGAHASFSSIAPRAQITQVYSSAQTGRLGFSCPHLKSNQYHPLPGVGIEIESPDEYGIGEILVSKPISPFLEFQRFPMGDSARLLPACGCGRTDAFELMGRTDFDFIKLAGALLHKEEFDRVMEELSTHVVDYQALVEEIREGDRAQGLIELRVVPTLVCGTSKESAAWLASEFARRTFVTTARTLENFIERGSFFPIRVEFVDSIAHGLKKVRLKKK
jgi:hypothetical protein